MCPKRLHLPGTHNEDLESRSWYRVGFENICETKYAAPVACCAFWEHDERVSILFGLYSYVFQCFKLLGTIGWRFACWNVASCGYYFKEGDGTKAQDLRSFRCSSSLRQTDGCRTGARLATSFR